MVIELNSPGRRAGLKRYKEMVDKFKINQYLKRRTEVVGEEGSNGRPASCPRKWGLSFVCVECVARNPEQKCPEGHERATVSIRRPMKWWEEKFPEMFKGDTTDG